jgi:hypothetical protein
MLLVKTVERSRPLVRSGARLLASVRTFARALDEMSEVRTSEDATARESMPKKAIVVSEEAMGF